MNHSLAKSSSTLTKILLSSRNRIRRNPFVVKKSRILFPMIEMPLELKNRALVSQHPLRSSAVINLAEKGRKRLPVVTLP